jgi:two-component system NarL family sensor kinase
MNQGNEIYFVTIIGIVLGLILVGFIVTMILLYQRRRHTQEQEMAMIKDKYEKEALRSQLEIQENTFKTIAQELHDNIGQLLSVVKLSLSALPIADLSDLTKSLHSDRINDVGLIESMRFELASIKRAGLLDIQFSVSGAEFQLPEQKAIVIFRMFQEMLNNILKHSRAKQITVRITYLEDGNFLLEVEDNGNGFNVSEKQHSVSSSRGVGLKSMFNRAQLIGATINIDSEPGKGTRVLVKTSSTERVV